MKIYDIGRELFSAEVYPGDPIPCKERVLSLEKGDCCNLSRIIMGSHSGTHVDAPSHFCQEGWGTDQIPLSKCVGMCKVVEAQGRISKSMMEEFLEDGTRKLLIKGEIQLTVSAAQVLAHQQTDLLGVEGQTVGEKETQEEIHKILLTSQMVIAEGLFLKQVEEGNYFLAAQPLKMKDVDGSPIRPILIGNWKNP